jgi:prolyl oligopeptidase
MNRASFFLACLAFFISMTRSMHTPAAEPANAGAKSTIAPRYIYPPTRRTDFKDTFFGVEVDDPYRWLEDGKAPDVVAWMKAQDEFARAELHKLPGRDAMVARLRELYYTDSVGVPLHRPGRDFYTRRYADKEKGVVVCHNRKTGVERVLLDPNTWSADGSLSLTGWRVSWDGKSIAYKVSKNNSDDATLHVLDVGTGKISTVDVIPGAKYANASWTPGGDGFYYTWIPTDSNVAAVDRPGHEEVRFHRLGTNPSRDRVVRRKTGDPRTFTWAGLSRDGHWLFYTIDRGTRSTDVWFRDMRHPGKPGPWQALAVGRPAIYQISAWKDLFYIYTDDGAPGYRVLRADPRRPERAYWREIVPERPGETLTGLHIVGNRLSLGYLKDVTSRIEVRELDGKWVRDVALPEAGSASMLIGNEDDDTAYYMFTSFTRTTEIYRTSVRTGRTKLWFKLKVPIDTGKFVAEQSFYTSRDGTRVPMFIVRSRDRGRDGSAPTLLYGYGGFDEAMTPDFDPSIFPWLEHGGVFAMPNVRGGSEYGEDWHKLGMRLKKQNVFDDFIAAAEYLISQGWTRPGRIAIQGSSNGGLLVGAALTQRPDLFGAAVCGVPLLDMLRYHLSGSGKTWIEEYGSADNEQDFQILNAYSPYQHVRPRTKYPPVLVVSADSDDRVDPMHARKFAARLQAASTGGPVLLRIQRHAGHGGADSIKSTVETTADEYAFALAEMGAK